MSESRRSIGECPKYSLFLGNTAISEAECNLRGEDDDDDDEQRDDGDGDGDGDGELWPSDGAPRSAALI